MIKYKLFCKRCEFSFDSWFASSKEYEKLKKKNFLNCHNCGSRTIEKTLMAPKLINKFKSDRELKQFYAKAGRRSTVGEVNNVLETLVKIKL